MAPESSGNRPFPRHRPLVRRLQGDASDPQQKFNLADLADGETRTFGEGGHAITATRKGDEVTLILPGEKGEKTLRCTIGKDSCSVMTVNGEGKRRRPAPISAHGTTSRWSLPGIPSS